MKRKEYYEFMIEYLNTVEYQSLPQDDLDNLLKLRNLNRRRKQHQKWVDKNEKIYNEYLSRKKLIKELMREEKEVFNEINLLKKVVIPIITIYKKDESSKSLKNKLTHYQRRTYKGKPLKKRIVYSCVVRMKTLTTKNQKNIYLGSKQKVEEVLNWYFDEVKFGRTENQIKNKVTQMLEVYFKHHLKNGWDVFSNSKHSFQGIIVPWLREYMEKQK